MMVGNVEDDGGERAGPSTLDLSSDFCCSPPAGILTLKSDSEAINSSNSLVALDAVYVKTIKYEKVTYRTILFL